MLGIFYVVYDLQCLQEPASFSRNPFMWLFVLCDSWYFCLGKIFHGSKENEKAELGPNCVTMTMASKGVNVHTHHSSVFVTVVFGSFCHLGSLFRLPEKSWDGNVLGVMSLVWFFPMCRCLVSLDTQPGPSRVVKGFIAEEIHWNEVLASCFGFYHTNKGAGQAGWNTTSPPSVSNYPFSEAEWINLPYSSLVPAPVYSGYDLGFEQCPSSSPWAVTALENRCLASVTKSWLPFGKVTWRCYGWPWCWPYFHAIKNNCGVIFKKRNIKSTPLRYYLGVIFACLGKFRFIFRTKIVF